MAETPAQPANNQATSGAGWPPEIPGGIMFKVGREQHTF